jgi:hypothetical protein
MVFLTISIFFVGPLPTPDTGSGSTTLLNFLLFGTVLGIRIGGIHRIHMFLGLPDSNPLIRDTDPDPALDPSLFS